MRAAFAPVAALVFATPACLDSTAQGKRRPDASVPANPAVTDVTAQDYSAPPLPTGKVVLPDAFGGKRVVEVEIATTPAAQQRGLMWRTSLEKGKGMLFVFPGGDEPHGFWMKNTLIPLDMIFIGQDKRVVGIVKNAAPKSLDSRYPGGPSKYVLEVPGGWSDEIGLKDGATVELHLGAAGVTP